VKFTSEGGRIGIDARQSNGSVEISVTDTGIGIAPQDQPKVFEEFARSALIMHTRLRGPAWD
jgi:signal transduction histidine kinase